MRGLACLLMFQAHCYDSWLSPAVRNSRFFIGSQLLATMPAPIFLFLAGVALALMTDKSERKGVPPAQVANTILRRGAGIFGLGILFRMQDFIVFPWAPWTDLLRVDILNTIGLAIVLVGTLLWIFRRFSSGKASALIGWSSLVALTIACATPPLYTTWRMRWLPWPLETYINGVHTFDQPQAWLFPIFPWSAFAFAGFAVGFVLASDWARRHAAQATALAGVAGLAFMYFSNLFDHNSLHLYSTYDYWHTSPNFFLIRVGILLLILFLSYAWCAWGPGLLGFSPLVQLGQTSLLVYWVHIEFVYGRFSILPKGVNNIARASLGLLIIFCSMLALSLLRTKMKGRTIEWWNSIRRPLKAF